jgi:hypothetical protein
MDGTIWDNPMDPSKEALRIGIGKIATWIYSSFSRNSVEETHAAKTMSEPKI